ncbi:MAG: 30S ribosomal protein S20 [Christensenellales bacterium]|jgi:small subunit ribosomal protein S20
MPNIKSQKKRLITNQKANERNKAKKTRVKNALKKYFALIAVADVEGAEKLLPETVSIIDRAKSDGIYKKNNAARKVAKVSKALSDLKKELAEAKAE